MLLVDDNQAMLARAASVLAATCVVVGQVQDGVAALAAAATLVPDVIVLDISMPGMTGLDVAARLRAAGSTAAIVFLTVHDDAELVEAAQRCRRDRLCRQGATLRQICCTPSTRQVRGAPSFRFAGNDNVRLKAASRCTSDRQGDRNAGCRSYAAPDDCSRERSGMDWLNKISSSPARNGPASPPTGLSIIVSPR